jgi:DNA-binding protein HU-beta
MNKTELVKNVARQIDGATQKDVAVLVDIVLETIVNTVASGEKVSLAGFGNFEVVERAARMGRNPKTGEALEITASKNPKFHALTGFKNAVKNA